MNTSALITFINRGAPDWSRQDILDFINDIQNMVYSRPLHYIRIIDHTTGKDKTLDTEAGTFEYMIDDVDYLGAIYEPLENSNSAYGRLPDPMQKRKFTYNFDSSDALSGQSRIIFSEDPGDNTLSYVAYKRPPALLHEGANISIPDQYLITHIAMGVWGLIEQFEHGNSNNWNKFMLELLPDIQNKLDSQSQDLIEFSHGLGM